MYQLFRLEDNFQPYSIVEGYESLIWTDRFWAAGDMELLIPAANFDLFTLNISRYLAFSESKRVMRIESHERFTDREGRRMVRVKARSLESHLEKVLFRRSTTSGYDSQGSWTATMTAPQLARFLVSQMQGFATDAFPMTLSNGVYPASTIPEPTEILQEYQLKAQPIYPQMVAICETYGLGFRIGHNFQTGQLYFDVYTGRDRTSRQTTDPAVIFGGPMGNLEANSSFLSTENYYNNIRVYGPNQQTFVGLQYVDVKSEFDTSTGLNLRTKLLVLDRIPVITGTTAEQQTRWRAYLTARGKEALARERWASIVDGEVVAGTYLPDRDYYVGDVIEIRSYDGEPAYPRVLEQIFVSDKEGERTYPSLS